MRYIRFTDPQGEAHLGRDRGDGTADVIAGNVLDLANPPQPVGRSAKIARLLAPIIPSNIYCIGLNYREHAKEGGQEIPTQPVIFMKPTSAVNHPGEPIQIPAACRPEGEVDYECELAVVIGRPGKNIPRERALQHVAGYTAANDVSARHWQRHGGANQWIRGKSFDTFCPLGPALLTPDEIPDPQKLRISTRLNGQTMQDHTTGDMIFSVADLIAFISRDTTLNPGTVILTGTPQGVGFARKPPVWLKPGDEVVVEIEKIGRLVSPIIAAQA